MKYKICKAKAVSCRHKTSTEIGVAGCGMETPIDSYGNKCPFVNYLEVV